MYSLVAIGLSVIKMLACSRKCASVIYFVIFSIGSSQAQETVDTDDYEPATYSQQGRPQFTISRYEDAWLVSSYMVAADGRVEDFVILDSSGLEIYENRVKQVMGDIEFSPAKLNGEHVASAGRQQHVLTASGMVGNPDFATDFNAFNSALREQQFEFAAEILDRMGARRIRGNYEFALLSLARFQLGLEQGMSSGEQINHLYRSQAYTGSVDNTHSDYYLPDDVRLGARQSLLQLLLKTNRFAEATSLYSSIKDDLTEDLVSRFESVFERVRGIKASDQVYAVEGKLSDTGAWLLPLYKRGFGITQGHELLERAQLRCSVGSYNVSLKPEADFQAPEQARSCSLLMQGEPGAEISLIQF